MPTDQAMLDEAISAARAGDKVRARDLLTRLLRIDKNYAEHWLWMSAVVESRQEQIYCLQNLLRVDPNSIVARRGLAMMGALELDPKELPPVPPHRRQAWTTAELEIAREKGLKAILANPYLRISVYLAAGIMALILISAGVLGLRNLPATPTPNFAQTAAAVGAVITLTPTMTASPTVTPEFPTLTPTPAAPTPLWYLLEATYTPTPLFVDTPHPETQAFNLGMNAMEREDWDAVIEYMGQTLEIAPGAADAYYYMGLAHLNSGDFETALEAFNQAILIDNAFGPAYLGRALASLALDPEADVAEDFQDAVDLAPGFGLVYIERARYAIQQGDLEDAEADLDLAAGLMPESPWIPYLRAEIALARGDNGIALNLAETAHALDLTHLPTYRLLGEILLNLGEPLEAREWLSVYNFQVRGDSAGLNLLARTFSETGDFQPALQIFDQLIRDGIADAGTYYGRGIAHLENGDPEAALSDLNQATRLRRNDFDINLGLGRALLALGDPGDAYVQFNNTFELVSNDLQLALIRYYRGLALKVLVDNGDSASYPAAVRDLEAAIALSEHLPEALAESAEALLEELISTHATATPEA